MTLVARPAPSDAAPLMALLARADLAAVEAKRKHLLRAIELAKPRRSTILENRLKQLTREMLAATVAMKRSTR